eukprot:CAMPEP_0184742612 /NCGR_PEP_ID=MMETSP0315-20130426/5553_1 /TAXON_ID=101924 /ORGANISM="Rhodosorus marinus, Strain UTEX LB 2760" /LENGTH=1602 /DNA_ID=CAMNT_0027213511 /DNA_START=56 /DNA_END=4864 /DNA_ORIENTATION=+
MDAENGSGLSVGDGALAGESHDNSAASQSRTTFPPDAENSTKSNLSSRVPTGKSDADFQKSRGSSFGSKVLSKVFSSSEIRHDVKKDDIKTRRGIFEYLSTFLLDEDMQEHLQLTRRAFVSLGLFTIVTSVILFLAFFFANGKCSTSAVLTLEPTGENCTTTLFSQTADYELDTNGVFRGQPNFVLNQGLIKVKLKGYEGSDEEFSRDLDQALSLLREETERVGRMDAVRTMQRLLHVEGHLPDRHMLVVWNIDPGNLLRSQFDRIENIVLYRGQEELSIVDNPALCTHSFERVFISSAPILPNSAESYATVRIKISANSAEDSALVEPPVWRVSEGVDSCEVDLEPSRETSDAFGSVLGVFSRKQLSTDEESFVLAFDVLQTYTISQCNEEGSATCDIESTTSPAGYELFYSDALEKYAFRDTIAVGEGDNKQIVVVPEIGPHPGIPECNQCEDASTDPSMAEICQRNAAVLLKYYEVDVDEQPQYIQSAYLVLRTRDIWNAKYGTEQIHCGVENLLRPIDVQNDVTIPFATSSGVFECDVVVCKSIIERLGTAEAVAELFLILVLGVIAILYIIVTAFKNLPRSKRGIFFGAVGETFASEEIKEVMGKSLGLRIAISIALIAAVLATFICFLVIPETCQPLETLSFEAQTDNNANCTEVLLTQNRELVIDNNQNFANTPDFSPGSAFHTVLLRSYSTDGSSFTEDLRTTKIALNEELSAADEDQLDSIVKHELLLFSSANPVQGVTLRYNFENLAAGSISSPGSVDVLVRAGSDGCYAALETNLEYGRIGLLRRESPLLGFSIREVRSFFDVDQTPFNPCFESAAAFEEALDTLVADFERVSGGSSPFRIDIFMADLILVDACNRPQYAGVCQNTVVPGRADIVQVGDGRFGLVWPTNVGFIGVAEIVSECPQCSEAAFDICDRFELAVSLVDQETGESPFEILFKFSTELPLNGLGTVSTERCSVQDVLLDPAIALEAPFETSSDLYSCQYEVCSSWISRLGTSFADTDFILELVEIGIAIIFLIVGLSALSNWRGLVVKTLPSKTRNFLTLTWAFLIGAFLLMAFVGLFAGFFVLNGECTTSTTLTVQETGDSCDQVMLRQDGTFVLDTNGRFNREAGFNGRNALFQLQFLGYRATESELRASVSTLLTSFRELLESVEGTDLINVYRTLIFNPVSVPGKEGRIVIAANINHQFITRWVNVESSEANTDQGSFPLEAIWFTDEQKTTIDTDLDQCLSESSVVRARVTEEEVETLVKVITMEKSAVALEPNTCLNNGFVEAFAGATVLRSFVPSKDTTSSFEETDDLHVSFDSAQVFGLDFCNKNPSNCESRIRPPESISEGRNTVTIPASWEFLRSLYDEESGLYGFKWETGNNVDANGAERKFFVVPTWSVPTGCECENPDRTQSCAKQINLVLRYYSLAEGEPLEYVTSFAKKIDMTGLWNSVGSGSSLHCDLSVMTGALGDEEIRAISEGPLTQFETDLEIFQCEQTLCAAGVERFGDSYALAKLIIVCLIFCIVFVVLVMEFRYSESKDVEPATMASVDSEVESISGDYIDPENGDVELREADDHISPETSDHIPTSGSVPNRNRATKSVRIVD